MIWQDTGFLISKNKYNENSSISEFYTENHGKVTGFIFGSTSKKIKNYLLVGNKFYINFNSKHDGKLGYFKVEIDKINTPIFLDNKKKLYCIIYSMHLIKILTVDNQENKNIFYLIDNLFKILNQKSWLIKYLFWELNIYKEIGYEIDFKDYVKDVIYKGDKKFIVESSNKLIPNFLIDKNELTNNNNDIFNAFKIVGDFLDKTILKPNNKNYPLSRIEFVNLIKRF
tara:strand:+ start:56 stop:736 length:681 start_codon:yes stop_codon:yes gene_type:complete